MCLNPIEVCLKSGRCGIIPGERKIGVMYCQICRKKSATVHFTELSGNKKVEVHICRDCADEKGFLLDLGSYAAELFSGLKDKRKPEDSSGAQECGLCGMKYADFKSSGKLGCGDCYTAFAGNLSGVIRKIHGSSVHAGKTPGLSGELLKRRELARRRRELRELVSQERFEEASRMRDLIKSLEKEPEK
jgi:protein arginine kinase activator